MDINTFRSLATVLMALAFIGVCWWAYSPKRRKRFEDAARLPFAEDAALPGSESPRPESTRSDTASDKHISAAEQNKQGQL